MIKKIKHIGIAVACILGICFQSTVQATPLVYQFSANNFTAAFGAPVPLASVTGNFTLDLTTSTVSNVNLTILTHTYSDAEVGFLPTWIVGGNLNGINSMLGGTYDFWLTGVFSDLSINFFNFEYSVSGVNDFFSSYNVAVTTEQSVPEPSSLALAALAVATAAFFLRKNHQISK